MCAGTYTDAAPSSTQTQPQVRRCPGRDYTESGQTCIERIACTERNQACIKPGRICTDTGTSYTAKNKLCTERDRARNEERRARTKQDKACTEKRSSCTEINEGSTEVNLACTESRDNSRQRGEAKRLFAARENGGVNVQNGEQNQDLHLTKLLDNTKTKIRHRHGRGAEDLHQVKIWIGEEKREPQATYTQQRKLHYRRGGADFVFQGRQGTRGYKSGETLGYKIGGTLRDKRKEHRKAKRGRRGAKCCRRRPAFRPATTRCELHTLADNCEYTLCEAEPRSECTERATTAEHLLAPSKRPLQRGADDPKHHQRGQDRRQKGEAS